MSRGGGEGMQPPEVRVLSVAPTAQVAVGESAHDAPLAPAESPAEAGCCVAAAPVEQRAATGSDTLTVAAGAALEISWSGLREWLEQS